MDIGFSLEHVGYITDSIKTTAKTFSMLGYEIGSIVNDETQRARICFLRKSGETNIELVEPYEDNKTMQKMLKKGVSPYHTCYEVEDVYLAYDLMIDAGFTPLFKPVKAPAFGNREICYFWKSDIGLLEIVNK